jgi:hypothetical protein
VDEGWQCTLPTPPPIKDPGFEATEILGNGTLANAFWTEYSSYFDNAVICSFPICGALTGSGAASGDYWAWLGADRPGPSEEARLSQEVTIPVNASELSFALEVRGDCVPSSDYMELLVDGERKFDVNGNSPLCGNEPGYRYMVQSVDISDHADGGVHTIEFHAVTFGSVISVFFVDDVYIPGTPSACTDPIFTDGFESN